ncbi:12500_t:CDS:2 [Dentiscutata erythropus]|uniref:12500_t:CDS:1 n=1 Tax=Dentiscutata erythropus TaxID=1348616 RepID=A0A9N8W3L5_9GLOM|nr:12500_t:CDS:2 [Dentiscutata erythropus]
MTNLYEKVMAELLDPNNNNPISNTAPLMIHYKVTKSKLRLLNNSFTNPKEWEIEKHYYDERPSCTKKLSRYYATAAVQTYYIFHKWGIVRIDQTMKLTLPMIYELKAKDYQIIVN